ncbi:hypothetical protein [Caulobacter sp. NIBR1757]|uniref:hypothetical protein n=1 Tax=Caulobacter sp. NIBR1757 TaxID=3016000 RepID=UPI0022F08FD2|nr:hypothetical protein [Caulobacter sp. NIBR1757]WGM37676.1 hypothetical protein AMEJIAPC_00575 [Caulobacter sp. NIBR1757]
MSRLWLFLIMAALPMAIVVVVALPSPSGANSSAFEPVGYTRVVRDVFAAESFLVRGEGDEQVVRLQNNFDRAAPKAVVDFYRQSSLRRDIALNDAKLWRFDGKLIGFAAGAQAVPSPFAADGWRGRLDARDTSRGAVLWEGAVARARLSPGSLIVETEAQPVRLEIFGRPEDALAALPAGAIIDLSNPQGTLLARIRQIGGNSIIEAKIDGVVYADAATEALSAGKGRQLFPASMVRIKDPATRREAVFSVGSEMRAFSAPQPLGGRRTDPQYRSLVRPVETALDSVVAACAAAAERCDALRRQSFRMTLDLDLDRSVNALLQRDRAGSAFPAAVVIMNAKSGDVLSMASYDPSGAEPLWSGQPDPTPVNYAFMPLSIGSTAKPPVSAAILSKNPALRTLQIHGSARYLPCDGEPKNYVTALLGVALGTEENCDPWISTQVGAGDWLNFRDFLRISSNEYAASLSVLALSPNLDRRGNAVGTPLWRLGEGPARNDLPILQQGALHLGPSGPAYGRLLNFPDWRYSFDAMFGAGSTVPVGPGLADYSIWRNLALDEIDPQARWRESLAASSPARLAFAYDDSLDVTNEYVPIILGGQNSPWSTVKLAEAYARLVTGSAIRARLVTGAADNLPMPGYATSLRAQVCDGLSAVMAGGTGASGAGPAGVVREWRGQPGLPIALFGKTGTPRVDQVSPLARRQVEAETRLLNSGYIVMSGGLLGVKEHSGLQPAILPMTARQAADAAWRLSHDPVAKRLLAGASASSAANRILKFNTGEDAERHRNYEMTNGIPTRVKLPDPTQHNDAHVLAFVVAIYPEGSDGSCTKSQPVAAYAVAINIQDPEGDAIRLGGRILRQLEGNIRISRRQVATR